MARSRRTPKVEAEGAGSPLAVLDRLQLSMFPTGRQNWLPMLKFMEDLYLPMLDMVSWRRTACDSNDNKWWIGGNSGYLVIEK